jgi:dephospho-CoA kinase
MKNQQLHIGVTGGIGSGKSTVCKIFNSLGIPIYDADYNAKRLMSNDPEIRSQIISNFGEEAYQDGQLNRKFLASKVFNDEANLKIINQIVHPQVAKDFEEWTLGKTQVPYLLKEAALLFESGSYKKLDKIIAVIAPENLRIKRVLIRDLHRNEADIKAIIQKQLSEKELRAKADFVIKNDGESFVIPQVLKLHEKFLKIAEEKKDSHY